MTQSLFTGTGIIPSPLDCYLVSRSLKTLAIRLEQQQRNSLEVAKYLEMHQRIARVLHPGHTYLFSILINYKQWVLCVSVKSKLILNLIILLKSS